MEDLSNGFEMRQGDDIDLEFVLRGDDKEKTVRFLFDPAGGISATGDVNDEFRLSQYEDEVVHVEMTAEEPGVWEVFYGVVEEADGDAGFGVDSYTTNSFFVEVLADDDYDSDDDFDVLVDSTESGSSGGRSGGGGGGGGLFSQDEEEQEKIYDEYGLWYDDDGTAYLEDGTIAEQDYIDFLKKSAEEQEVILQDISTQGSSTTEGVVDNSGVAETIPTAATPIVDDGGKNILAAVLFFGALAMLFTFGAANYVNREGSK
jgi:hypothetical protein